MKFICLFFLLLFNISLQAQIITTFAGTGTYGYKGDGGLAIDAQLSDMYYCYPAFDKAGNMYIATNFSNTIRKIDKSGIITTIAGTRDVIGYTGDGGPAINALLYHPTTLAADNSGNLIISDRNGTVLRKIDASGIITTISGQYAVTCGVGDGGPLINAQFEAISAITTDAVGNLYITDYGCNTIRKVNSAGVITTIAGNGTYGFSGDGGLAINAQMAYPCKIAVDNAGNVYIADAQNHRIRKVNTAGIITTVAGNGTPGYSGDGGPATLGSLYLPGSVVIDNAGNLYTGDYNNVVRKIDQSGIITTYAGNGITGYTGDGGPALLAELSMTEGRISIDNNNNIYFADDQNHIIRRISNCLTATISTQPANASLCSSGDTAFFINATNANSFAWQVNSGGGWSNIIDNSTYSGAATNKLAITGANTGMNGYLYRCTVTNNCGDIFSLSATLTVTAPLAPNLTISATADTICNGTTVTFTALAANGGTAPVYQWKKNGLDVGTDSSVYSDNTLVNGDFISSIVTSSSFCVTTNTAASNAIKIVVNPILVPSISISSSVNNICYGIPVNFSSLIVNGGSNPAYEWMKNGVVIGNDSLGYSDTALNNGDIIACKLTTNYSCPATPEVLSNKLVMNVTPLSVPSVAISTLTTSVCPGTPVSFDAVASTGLSVSYQWKKNNASAGINSNTYTDSTISQGDIINCSITATGTCLASQNAVSNSITMTLYQTPVVALDHSPSICFGSNKLLDAGNFSSYVWNDGSTNRTLPINNTGAYFVTATDNNGCKGSDTTIISTILPKPVNFLPADTSICNYGSIDLIAKPGYQNYLWNNNSNTAVIKITQPGLYWLEVTDNNNCKGKDSILVSPKQCINGFYIPTAFTPNSDGKNDLFKPLIFGSIINFRFIIYNRWGQIVFESTDPVKGWDGNFKGSKQDNQAFVWTCLYQFEGEKQEVKKGTVVLIR